MLKVNYEYKGGVLFVRLVGNLDSKNIYLLSNSIKEIIRIGGFIYIVINVENVVALNDSYLRFLIDDIKKGNVYLCGYNSLNYNNNYLVEESSIFKYIDI